jgi:hypothetical protein
MQAGFVKTGATGQKEPARWTSARALRNMSLRNNDLTMAAFLHFNPPEEAEKMKNKLLVLLFLAGSSLFAGPRFFVGFGVGPRYYAPAPVYAYGPAYPGPAYVGGYYSGYYGPRYVGRPYYARPAFRGRFAAGPRYYNRGYYGRGFRR